MKRLAIISHTEHYKNLDGEIVGFGSTVTEINHLLEVFDEIIHVAMLHSEPAPASALSYISNKITFIPIPNVGGPQLKDKFSILWQAPIIISRVKKAIQQADYFQFRAPTSIGVYVIPYLILFNSKNGWFKYAGNWNQKKAPLAYSFQRWLLKRQKRVVTINGKWPDQPNQCLTFENPCLTEEEVEKGQSIMGSKCLKGLISFCFVGRLEEEKGLDLLINVFKELTNYEKIKIDTIHIVGNGKSMNNYKKMVENIAINFVFHGFLSRIEVQKIYSVSHGIILPSVSEGFPKVIAEAMNFGCLPIVSNISSIGHYVKDKINGLLLDSINNECLLEEIRVLLSMSNSDYSKMIMLQKKELEKFTFKYYNNRILKEIIS